MNSPASTPPRTFIAGASGYTGQALVRICREAGATTHAHLRPRSAQTQLVSVWEDLGAELSRVAWEASAVREELSRLKPELIFSLLGTTAKRDRQASSDERRGYEAIDYGLTHMLLEAAKTLEAPPRFVYLSCTGANASSRNPYISVRGRLEAELDASGLSWVSARPVFISGEDRAETRPAERIGSIVFDGLLNTAAALGAKQMRARWGSMNAQQLASALWAVGVDPTVRGTIEAHDLRKRI